MIQSTWEAKKDRCVSVCMIWSATRHRDSQMQNKTEKEVKAIVSTYSKQEFHAFSGLSLRICGIVDERTKLFQLGLSFKEAGGTQRNTIHGCK